MRMLDSDAIPNGGIFIINTPIFFRDMDCIVKKATTGKSEESLNIPYGAAVLAGVVFSLLAKLCRRNMPLTLSRVRALSNRRVYLQERLLYFLLRNISKKYAIIIVSKACYNKLWKKRGERIINGF